MTSSSLMLLNIILFSAIAFVIYAMYKTIPSKENKSTEEDKLIDERIDTLIRNPGHLLEKLSNFAETHCGFLKRPGENLIAAFFVRNGTEAKGPSLLIITDKRVHINSAEGNITRKWSEITRFSLLEKNILIQAENGLSVFTKFDNLKSELNNEKVAMFALEYAYKESLKEV